MNRKHPDPANHPEIIIGLAIADDVAEIIEVERHAPSAAHWPESVYFNALSGAGPTQMILVARGRDAIRGFALARITSDECELENIAVAANQQKSGIGTRLIFALAAAAREQGASRIFLEVRESNAAARSFYEKCGFAISGRRRGYYQQPREDGVLYSLEL